MKICSKCKGKLTEDSFYQMGKYLSSMCKSCYSLRSKDLRKKKKDFGQIIDWSKEKKCTKCGETKNLTEFFESSIISKYGVRSQCKKCMRFGRSERYKRNKNRLLELCKKWKNDNRIKVRKTKIASERKRRFRKFGSTETLSREEIREIFELYNNMCVYCYNKADSIDHIVPLNKGGTDTVDNVVPACKPCNSSKQDKNLIVWACVH